MAKQSVSIERVAARLDKETYTYVLFFPDIKEGDGKCASWSEGQGHQPADIRDPKYIRPPHWGAVSDALTKYRRNYRGNYALSQTL